MTTPLTSKQAPVASTLNVLKEAPVAATKPLSETARQDIETLVIRAALRDGATSPETFAASVERTKARLSALMEAIGPDSPATHAFAHKLDADFKTHTGDGQEHTIAMQVIQSIFLNRRDDIQAALPLFDDKDMIAGWAKKVAEAKEAPALETALSPEKLHEIKASIIHEGEKIDAPAHFLYNFLAQHKSHAALADGFNTQGEVAQAIAKSVAELLPQDDKAAFKALLDDWMTYRAERANNVVEATRPDGELAQLTVRDWEAQRQDQGKKAPTRLAAANENSPAPAAEKENPKQVINAETALYEEILGELAAANTRIP